MRLCVIHGLTIYREWKVIHQLSNGTWIAVESGISTEKKAIKIAERYTKENSGKYLAIVSKDWYWNEDDVQTTTEAFKEPGPKSPILPMGFVWP